MRSSYSWTDWICFSLGKQHIHRYFISLLFQRPFLSRGIHCHTADPRILPCHRGSPVLIHFAHIGEKVLINYQKTKYRLQNFANSSPHPQTLQTRSIHWETLTLGISLYLYTRMSFLHLRAPCTELKATQVASVFLVRQLTLVPAFPEKTRKPEKALSSILVNCHRVWRHTLHHFHKKVISLKSLLKDKSKPSNIFY